MFKLISLAVAWMDNLGTSHSRMNETEDDPAADVVQDTTVRLAIFL